MNVIVVYASRQGHTRKIVQRMAEVLRAHGHHAELYDADQPAFAFDSNRFDAALVGAPIHAGGYPRAITRFVRAQRAFLEQVPSAFFSVGLAVASRTTDGRAETQPIVDKFITSTGWHPAHVELVAGALPYSKYNFFIRFVMRRIAAEAGGDTDTSRDYEYTDWAALERFVAEFAARAAPGKKPLGTAPAAIRPWA